MLHTGYFFVHFRIYNNITGILENEVNDMQKNKTKQNKTTSSDTISGNDLYSIRQNAHYNKNGKAEPDNNIFWEERSNPLSSKGN